MTQFFTAEVMDYEIAEILVRNPAYWLGLMADEGYRPSAKDMVMMLERMDGLERDEFMRQIQGEIETARIAKQ